MENPFNQINLIGVLTKDPETKFADNGTQMTRFRLAVKRSYCTKDTDTNFISILALGKLAKVVSRFCTKGTRVLVLGELNINEYEEDGKRKETAQVIAHRISIL